MKMADRLKVTDATGSIPLATRQARGQRRLLVSYRQGDAFDMEISAHQRPSESRAATCWRLVSGENRLRPDGARAKGAARDALRAASEDGRLGDRSP